MSRETVVAREAAKRRLMFVAGEDSYFLAYTLLLVLADLRATSQERAFFDSRKIAYIADFVSNASDMRLALVDGSVRDSNTIARLAILHDRAAARRVPLARVIDAIARREFISVARETNGLDKLHMLPDPIGLQLVNSALFEGEREHMRALRRIIPQLRTMSLPTLKQRLFGRHGVRTWHE